MVSYKEMYKEVKGKLKRLESNCIDLRSISKGQILTFSEKWWKLSDEQQEGMIKLQKTV